MRQRYLNVRNSFLTYNPSVTFLQAWCKEEGRPFEELDRDLRKLTQIPLLGEQKFVQCMHDLVDYLDKKYKVTILYSKDKEEVLKVY
jgi:hypothetical protein